MTSTDLLKRLLAGELPRPHYSLPPGTFAPGARVRKTKHREGDHHKVGALARTCSYPLGPALVDGVEVYGYFVLWDDWPALPCFVAGNVLEEVLQS